MKKLITAAILVAGAQLSHAKISINPEMGLNFANLPYNSGYNSGSDYHHQFAFKGGALANLQAPSGFFVQAGLFYSIKGSKLSHDDEFYKAKGSIRLNYIEMPLNIGYRYKIGHSGALLATVGPYVGYALSGSFSATEYVNDVAQSETKSDIAFSSSGTHRWDLGFNFGLGYQLPVGVFVKAQYCLGTNHVANGFFGSALVNRGYSFTVGYEIKFRKAKMQDLATK